MPCGACDSTGCSRGNRRIAELLDSFATDILAYINSNGAVKPVPSSAAPATKPAKPATTTGGVATASQVLIGRYPGGTLRAHSVQAPPDRRSACPRGRRDGMISSQSF